ncbi:MAG: N-acetylmuramoyl-L-alanine amidase, partial [Bacteroidales bacterium]|nr:N-acetylmuramoyl-L-alanine amidase [Bacteroidales bacterium]
AGKPEFRLQLFTSTSVRQAGDAAFKGLQAEYYKDGDTYKYTYGRTASYDDILNLKKTITDKFPGVFIVALLDGKRIDLQKAIELSKQK